MSKENKFKFVMPAEITKSESGDWKIAGLASTQEVDQQGETIMMKGVDLTPIDQKRGYFNYDHKTGPENLIGTIDGYSQGNSGLYVHGKLFKNHDRAKAVYSIMSSLGKSDQGRVGLSVEGQILQRDPKNPKIIKKCQINKVAVTLNPVNKSTYADLLKSMDADSIEGGIDFDSTEEKCSASTDQANIEQSSSSIPTFTADQVLEIVQKALSVGEGYTKAPNELTDGDAMATSDMKSPGKKKKKKKEPVVTEHSDPDEVRKALKPMSKGLYKSNMITMLDKLQILYPDCSRSEIWESLRDRMETRFPDILSADEEK